MMIGQMISIDHVDTLDTLVVLKGCVNLWSSQQMFDRSTEFIEVKSAIAGDFEVK